MMNYYQKDIEALELKYQHEMIEVKVLEDNKYHINTMHFRIFSDALEKLLKHDDVKIIGVGESEIYIETQKGEFTVLFNIFEFDEEFTLR